LKFFYHSVANLQIVFGIKEFLKKGKHSINTMLNQKLRKVNIQKSRKGCLK